LKNTGGLHQNAGYVFQATTGLSESLRRERNYHSTVGETGLQVEDAPKKEWGSTVMWRNDVKASQREVAEVRTLTKHDLQRGAKDFKPNSTVIAAVAESKKTRHFEVLDEYDRCLNLIVEEMSKATVACVRTVKHRLSTNKIDVQKLFDCMSDQFLTQLSQAQVEKVTTLPSLFPQPLSYYNTRLFRSGLTSPTSSPSARSGFSPSLQP
jgi:hypothetical protein